MKKVTRRSLRKFKRKVERLERELQRQRDYRRLADRERRYLRGLETIDEWEPWRGDVFGWIRVEETLDGHK